MRNIISNQQKKSQVDPTPRSFPFGISALWFSCYYWLWSRRRRFSIGAKSQSRVQKNLLHWIYRLRGWVRWLKVWMRCVATIFDLWKKFKINGCVLKSPDFIFYERRNTGSGLLYPWAFPLWVREKIGKSRFWKWPFGSFWAPEIVSGWVLSCSRKVSMFSGEVRTVFWDSDFRAE